MNRNELLLLADRIPAGYERAAVLVEIDGEQRALVKGSPLYTRTPAGAPAILLALGTPAALPVAAPAPVNVPAAAPLADLPVHHQVRAHLRDTRSRGIEILALGEPGADGECEVYRVSIVNPRTGQEQMAELQFARPKIPGWTDAALMAIVEDRSSSLKMGGWSAPRSSSADLENEHYEP